MAGDRPRRRSARGRQSAESSEPEAQDPERGVEEPTEDQQDVEAAGRRKSRRIISAKVAAEEAIQNARKPTPTKDEKEKKRKTSSRAKPAVLFSQDIEFDLEQEPAVPEEEVPSLPLQEPSKHLVDCSPPWLQELLSGQGEVAYPYKGIESEVGDPIGSALGAYMILRAFSWQLRLSPFTFDDLAEALTRQTPTPLIDEVHISLLRVIYLDDTPEERAMRYPDPALLDRLTWPEYLWDHLSQLGSKLINLSCAKTPAGTSPAPKAAEGSAPTSQAEDKASEESFLKMKGTWREGMKLPAQTDYYSLPAASKAAILALMCDLVLQTKPIKSELSSRMDKGHWVAGEGGTGGAFAMFTPEVRAAKAAAEEDDNITDANQFNDDFCALCRIGGGLLCCDGCPASYHLRCIGESSRSVPEGEWLCPECTAGGRHEAAGLRVPSLGSDPQGNPLWVAHGRMWGGAKGLSLAVDRANGMPVDTQLDEPELSSNSVNEEAGGTWRRGKEAKGGRQRNTVIKSKAAMRGWAVDQSVRMYATQGDTACALVRQVTEPSIAQEAAAARRKSAGKKAETDSEESDGESKGSGKAQRTFGRRGRVPSRKMQDAGSEEDEGQDSSENEEYGTDDSDYSDSDSSSDDSDDEDEGTVPHQSSLELLAKERPLPVQPEKYVNRYRNGWIALHAAQKVVLDEARKARTEPPEGLPTPLVISRFVWSHRGRREQGVETSANTPNVHIQAMADCLLRMERDLLGLLDGGWAAPGAEGAAYRYGWRQRVRDAKTALELKQGALELEGAIKWGIMEPQWRYQGFKSRTRENYDRYAQRAATARTVESGAVAQSGDQAHRQHPKDRFIGDPVTTIQSKRRCFKCTTCANPSWKKACMTPVIKFMDGHIEWQGVTIQEATNPVLPASSSKDNLAEGWVSAEAPPAPTAAPAPAQPSAAPPGGYADTKAPPAASGQPQAPGSAVKRGPGRPRKRSSTGGNEPPKKRGPGRPRKHPLPGAQADAPAITPPGVSAAAPQATVVMAAPLTNKSVGGGWLQLAPTGLSAPSVEVPPPSTAAARAGAQTDDPMQIADPLSQAAEAPVDAEQPAEANLPETTTQSAESSPTEPQPAEAPLQKGQTTTAVAEAAMEATMQTEEPQPTAQPGETAAAVPAAQPSSTLSTKAMQADKAQQMAEPPEAAVAVAAEVAEGPTPEPMQTDGDTQPEAGGQDVAGMPKEKVEAPAIPPEDNTSSLSAAAATQGLTPSQAAVSGTAEEDRTSSVAPVGPKDTDGAMPQLPGCLPHAAPAGSASPTAAPTAPVEALASAPSEPAPAAPEQRFPAAPAPPEPEKVQTVPAGSAAAGVGRPGEGGPSQDASAEAGVDPGRVRTLTKFFETVANGQSQPQDTAAAAVSELAAPAAAEAEAVAEAIVEPAGQSAASVAEGANAEENGEAGGSGRVLRDRPMRKCTEGLMEQDADGVWRLQVPRTVSRALVKTGIWASKASDTDLTSLPLEVLKKMEDIFNKSGDRRWAVRRIMRTGILAGQEVEYRRDRAAQAILQGVMTEDGKVQCFCPTCQGGHNVSCLEFEEHAGIANRTPVDYIYLKMYNMSIREFCYQAIDEDPPPIKLPGRPRPPGQPRPDHGPSRPPGAPERIARDSSGLRRSERAPGALHDEAAAAEEEEEEEMEEEEEYFSSDDEEQEDEGALVPDWRPGGRRMGHWWRESKPPEFTGWMVHRDAFTRAAGEFALPKALTKKLGRQGGAAPINGIVYRRVRKGRMLERSPVMAWRAAMEAATSISQVAIGIRELDAYIKWDCIRRPSPEKDPGHPLLGVTIEGKRPSEKGHGYDYQLLIPLPPPPPTPAPPPVTAPAQVAPAPGPAAPMGISMTPYQLAQLTHFGSIRAVSPAMAAAGYNLSHNPLAAVMSAIAAAAAANGIPLPTHPASLPDLQGLQAAAVPPLGHFVLPPGATGAHMPVPPAASGALMAGISSLPTVPTPSPAAAASGGLMTGIPSLPAAPAPSPAAAAAAAAASGPLMAGLQPVPTAPAPSPAETVAPGSVPGELASQPPQVSAAAALQAAGAPAPAMTAAQAMQAGQAVATPRAPGGVTPAAGPAAPTLALPQTLSAPDVETVTGEAGTPQAPAAAADGQQDEVAQEAKVPKEQLFTYTNSMEEVSIRIPYGDPTWVHERRLPLWMIRIYEDAIRRKEMKIYQDKQRSSRPVGTPMPFMELPEVADLCKICSKPFDEMVTDSFWITCDRCDCGYHGPCVGVSQEQNQEMGEDARWECPSCVTHKAERRAVALAKARERRLASSNAQRVSITASPGEATRKQASRLEETAVREAEDEEDEEAPVASGPAVYCICRTPEDGRGMVGCDGCDEWFHPTCVGVTFEEVEQMDTFLCPLCARKEAKRAQKKSKGQEATVHPSLAPAARQEEKAFTVRFNLPDKKHKKEQRKERKGGRRGRPLVELTDEEAKLLRAQLRKAHTIMKSIMKLKSAFVFNEPVPLEIPYYHEMIRHPMDLGTICNRLEERGHYRTPFQVLKDVQLVWANCRQYNMPESDIWKAANVVEAGFDKQWGSAGLPVKEHPKIKKILKQEKLAAMGILPAPPMVVEPQVDKDDEEMYEATPAADKRAARLAKKAGAATDPGPARKRSRLGLAQPESEDEQEPGAHRKSSRRGRRSSKAQTQEGETDEDEQQESPRLTVVAGVAPPITFTVPRRPRDKRTVRPRARLLLLLPKAEEPRGAKSKPGRRSLKAAPPPTEMTEEAEVQYQPDVKSTPARRGRTGPKANTLKATEADSPAAPSSSQRGRGGQGGKAEGGATGSAAAPTPSRRTRGTPKVSAKAQAKEEAAVEEPQAYATARKSRVSFRTCVATPKAKGSPAPEGPSTAPRGAPGSKLKVRPISTAEADAAGDSQPNSATKSSSKAKARTPAKSTAAATPPPRAEAKATQPAAPATGGKRGKKAAPAAEESSSPQTAEEPTQLAPPPLYSMAVVGALLEVDRDSDGQYYRCTVLRVHRDWTITVQFEDGRKESQIPMARVRPLNDLRAVVGARVECYWELDDAYYPGTVRFVNPDGSLDVDYDDGDEDTKFPLAQARLLASGSKKVKLKLCSPPGSPPLSSKGGGSKRKRAG